jgi:tetratricopeptide (TPR) repeat protein
MSKPKVQGKATIQKKKGDDKPPQVNVSFFQRHVLEFSIGLCLILIILAAFWQVRNNEFINLDDDLYVTDNPHIKEGLTLGGVLWAFTTVYSGHWHPITWLSHMLDYNLYGLNPGGHHVTSLIFHIANTLLLFLLFQRMTGKPWRSSFLAALFAVHPLRVESVAWGAERKDVLCAFFWLLTMWTYAFYVGRPKVRRYLVVVLCFILALMSKPMAVTLPFVLILMDYWPLARLKAEKLMNFDQRRDLVFRLILEKAPFFFLTAVFSSFTIFCHWKGGTVASFDKLPLEMRIGNALVSYITYISKMIWPNRLAVLYPYPISLPIWEVVGAALLLIIITVLVILLGRKRPYYVVGWLWYFVTLVPVIGLVQAGPQAMADRFTYLPLIGLLMIIAYGLPNILAGWRYRRVALCTSGGLVLLACMVTTMSQVKLWQNSIRLFNHALKVTVNNAIIHNNLGLALAVQGRSEDAIAHYVEALRLKPYFVEAHNNLGNALVSQEKYQEAIDHYAECLRIMPNFAKAHSNLGVALARQGKNQEAIVHYIEALRIKPDDADAHYNLGNELARQERFQEAIPHFFAALRINPDDADAQYNLGNALARQKRFQEAIPHFVAVLRVKPDDAEVHCNLGLALAEQGKTKEAITHYIEALRIKPDFAEAHFYLALAYFMIGNRSSALEEQKILKTLHPDLANVLSQKMVN